MSTEINKISDEELNKLTDLITSGVNKELGVQHKSEENPDSEKRNNVSIRIR